MREILISGCYGVNNLGDDFILMSIVGNLVSQYGDDCKIKVISNGDSLDWLLKEYPNCKIVNNKGNKYKNIIFTTREIITSDYFIIGGGGLYPFESKKQLLIQSLYFRIAKLFHCKIVFFGIEINPLKFDWSKKKWKYFCNKSQTVITRNFETKIMLSEIAGIDKNKLHSFSDVTFAFETSAEKKDEKNKYIIPKEKYLLLALAMPWNQDEMKSEHYQIRFNKFKKQLAYVIKNIEGGVKSVVFLPFYGKSDIYLINALLPELDFCEVKVIDDNYPIQYKRLLFKYASHVFAMRFHSVLFSLYYATPFTAISYSPKTTSVLKEHGLDNYMVEFGIRESQFFYKEFDLDEEIFLRKINENFNNENYKNKLQQVSNRLKKEAKASFSKLFSVMDENNSVMR